MIDVTLETSVAEVPSPVDMSSNGEVTKQLAIIQQYLVVNSILLNTIIRDLEALKQNGT